MSNLFVGLDLSLTSSGMCLKSDGKVVVIESVKTVPNYFTCDLERYAHIVDKVLAFIPEDVALVVVEDFFTPTNSAQIGSAMKLIGLGHLVRMRMYQKKIPFVVPAPTQLKKFVSGKGTCPKDMICKEVWKKWAVDTSDDDQADAVVGANLAETLACKMRGGDVTELPKYQLEVVSAVLQDRPFYNRESFK